MTPETWGRTSDCCTAEVRPLNSMVSGTEPGRTTT
jgi:hypothetical protein